VIHNYVTVKILSVCAVKKRSRKMVTKKLFSSFKDEIYYICG